MGLEDVPRCQHVKTNGTQCGSPALRSRRHCYFHDRVRREQAKVANALTQRRFDLPLLEDANSVQMALMKVIQMLGSGQMDHKTAGLMLYALQTASVNLRYTEFEASDVTDIVIDRDTVAATCINGPQWFEEDFEDEELNVDDAESEEEVEGEVKDGSSGELQANAAPNASNAEKKHAERKEVKEASVEETRKQVQGLVRNWLLQTITQKPQ